MVDTTVSFAVKKLGEFLIEQGGLLQGARDDVNWLKDEFEWMQSFIEAAEGNQSGDDRVQKWISDIKNVAFDTLSILERYSSKVEGLETPKHGTMNHLRAWGKSPKKNVNLYKIALEIKSLRERLGEISRRVRDYHVPNFGDGGEGTSADLNRIRLISQPLRRTTSFMTEDHEIVGFLDETNKLLTELAKEDHRRCIISIYGMGGLGKTTLAQKLYNSNQIRSNFDCQAWVCVSQEYKIDDLLRMVIKSFKKSALDREQMEILEKMNQEDFARHLHQLLKESRYLVVLDDVWDKEVCKILKKSSQTTIMGVES